MEFEVEFQSLVSKEERKSSYITETTKHEDLYKLFQKKIGKSAILEAKSEPNSKQAQEVTVTHAYPYFAVVHRTFGKHSYSLSVNYGSLISGTDILEFI